MGFGIFCSPGAATDAPRDPRGPERRPRAAAAPARRARPAWQRRLRRRVCAPARPAPARFAEETALQKFPNIYSPTWGTPAEHQPLLSNNEFLPFHQHLAERALKKFPLGARNIKANIDVTGNRQNQQRAQLRSGTGCWLQFPALQHHA